jgi:transcriptional regulator with XRE-family HTH domain
MNIVTGAQIRAARALLDWGQDLLARKSKVSVGTIRRMEEFGPKPVVAVTNTLAKVTGTIEAAGVQFLNDGRGVMVRTR